MPFSITKEFVILCEGAADQVFFDRLLKERGIAYVDVPRHEDLGRHYGWQGLGRMLNGLAGDPAGYSKIKGVLLIADSADDPVERFEEICKKVSKDGPFLKPNGFMQPAAPYEIAKQAEGHPTISIFMVPQDTPGALETLCVDAIVDKNPWLNDCINAYLSCGSLEVRNWPAEKRDKARMQCISAVLYREDPNKPLQHVLSASPTIIDFSSSKFTPIVNAINGFCSQA
jgi:hypothetical protein